MPKTQILGLARYGVVAGAVALWATHPYGKNVLNCHGLLKQIAKDRERSILAADRGACMQQLASDYRDGHDGQRLMGSCAQGLTS